MPAFKLPFLDDAMKILTTVKLATSLSLVLLLSGCPLETVNVLNGTKFGEGRLPESAGSIRVQNWLIEQLETFSNGATDGNGRQSFKQGYSGGTNILAVIPGTDLANEYVIMGAHYDHLGTNCISSSQYHRVCNGATDNATGVAAVLEIAEQMKNDGFVNRRTLVLALWDEEEQGLLGSRYYVNNPEFPLAQTVAYVNFDILGAKLLSSLGNESFVIGAESGGSFLQNTVSSATNASSSLNIRRLNAVFGHRMSDQTNFLANQVPSVFFTDGIGGCYHTAQDSLKIVSFSKLDDQIAIAEQLVRDLLSRSSKPAFTNVAINQQDASALLNYARSASSDRPLFSQRVRNQYDSMIASLQNLSTKPGSQFNDADRNTLVTVARNISSLLRENAPCQSFDG